MAPVPPPPPPPVSSDIPSFTSTKSNSKPPNLPNTSALLKSIEKGAKLKKTVTNDRSAPLIRTKSNSNTSAPSSTNSSGNISNTSAGLGGLFANGFPALRSTKNSNASVVKPKSEIPSKAAEKISDSITRNPEKTLNIADKGVKLMSPIVSSQTKNQGKPPKAPSKANTCQESKKWNFPILDDKELPSPRKFIGHKKQYMSEITKSEDSRQIDSSATLVSEDDIETFIRSMKTKLKKAADQENFEECVRLKTKLKSFEDIGNRIKSGEKVLSSDLPK